MREKEEDDMRKEEEEHKEKQRNKIKKFILDSKMKISVSDEPLSKVKWRSTVQVK